MVHPEVLMPLPEEVICVIVSVAFPLLVTVTDCVALLPTSTLPNAMLEGFTLMPAVLATPVAVTPIVVGELPALLTTVTVPLAGPDALTENVTVNDVCWFGARVSGSASPLTLSPEPCTVT